MGSSTEGGDALTAAGYWAEVAAMGLQRLRQITPNNWIARDRHGLIVPVRDPNDLSPAERRAVLDDLLEAHVGGAH